MTFNKKMETYFIGNFKSKLLGWKKDKAKEEKEEQAELEENELTRGSLTGDEELITPIETEIVDDKTSYSESGAEGIASHFKTESVAPPAHKILNDNVRLQSSVVADYGLNFDEVIFEDGINLKTMLSYYKKKLLTKLFGECLIEKKGDTILKLKGRIFVCHYCCRFFGEKDAPFVYDRFGRAMYCDESCFNKVSEEHT